MKKFIIKSILFLLGFYIIAFIIQSILVLSITNINVGEYGVLNKLVNGKINTDILISGSSRGLKGLNPKIISELTGKSCFNISTDGCGLEIQLPKIKEYFKKNKKPLMVVQEVSPFGGGIAKTIYEPYKYIPYMQEQEIYEGLLKIEPHFWVHKYIYPTNFIYFNFDFYMKLLHQIGISIKGKDYLINGHHPDFSKWSTDFSELKQKRPKGIQASFGENYDDYLNELIELCSRNNVILILVSLPVHYEIFRITQGLNMVKSYYINKSNNRYVYFFDFSNSYISQDNNFFYNHTHLNNEGAIEFSQLLSKDLQLLLLPTR